MTLQIYGFLKYTTFILWKLLLFMCLAQGYGKNEKEKISKYTKKNVK